MSKLLPNIKAFLEVDVKAIRQVQPVVRKDLSRGIKVRSGSIVFGDKKIPGHSFNKEVTDIFNSSKGNTGFKNKKVNTDLPDDEVNTGNNINSLKKVTRCHKKTCVYGDRV